jgi:hypothetical protein
LRNGWRRLRWTAIGFHAKADPAGWSFAITDSYGYRPGKCAVDAVHQARQRCWRYDWVFLHYAFDMWMVPSCVSRGLTRDAPDFCRYAPP